MLSPEALGARYRQNLTILDQARERLESETRAALVGVAHVDRIAYRVKGGESFIEKAMDASSDPPYSDPLVEIEDQVAGRIIVFFHADIEVVRERLTGTFNSIESSRRKPARDEEFGYESHHLVCMIPPQCVPQGWEARDDLPKTFELQIRTLFMHAWAEPQHQLGYKGSQDLPREVRRELAWIAASAWGADQAYGRVSGWAKGRPK